MTKRDIISKSGDLPTRTTTDTPFSYIYQYSLLIVFTAAYSPKVIDLSLAWIYTYLRADISEFWPNPSFRDMTAITENYSVTCLAIANPYRFQMYGQLISTYFFFKVNTDAWFQLVYTITNITRVQPISYGDWFGLEMMVIMVMPNVDYISRCLLL